MPVVGIIIEAFIYGVIIGVAYWLNDRRIMREHQRARRRDYIDV